MKPSLLLLTLYLPTWIVRTSSLRIVQKNTHCTKELTLYKAVHIIRRSSHRTKELALHRTKEFTLQVWALWPVRRCQVLLIVRLHPYRFALAALGLRTRLPHQDFLIQNARAFESRKVVVRLWNFTGRIAVQRAFDACRLHQDWAMYGQRTLLAMFSKNSTPCHRTWPKLPPPIFKELYCSSKENRG